MTKLLLFIVMLLPQALWAAQIEFPIDELARETVLPVFDEAPAVLDRNVKTAGRFELGPTAGYSLNEPFYSEYGVGGIISYHLTEIHGFNLNYSYALDDPTQYATDLDSDTFFKGRLSAVPRLQQSIFFNYQWTTHYGKISLTKKGVMNLHLFFQLGAGAFDIGGDFFPGISLGLGQKFYFTPSIALRADLRFMGYQGPNVLDLKSGTTLSASRGELGPSDFETETYFPVVLSLGLVFLL